MPQYTAIPKEITNAILTSPTINGTVTTTGLTMPTFTLDGALNVNSYYLDHVYSIYGTHAPSAASIGIFGQRNITAGPDIVVDTLNGGGIATDRLTIGGYLNTSIATWSAITHSGFVITPGQAVTFGDSTVQSTAAVSATIIRKTADETVNNSAVLQNDDELLLAVAANEIWHIRFIIVARAATLTNGMNIDITVPAAGAYTAVTHGLTYNSTVARIISFINGVGGIAMGILNTANCITTIDVVYVGGANAGNVQFQWAQASAEANDLIVRANSCLIALQLV